MLRRLVATTIALWAMGVSPPPPAAAALTSDARYAKSEEIRRYMNESVDPCESFFNFTCGNWKTYHPSNASVTQTNAYNMATDDFKQKLAQLLTTTETDADSETESAQKVKNFYESCRQLASLKRSDYTDRLKEIVREFGQMPVLAGDKWEQQDFDWLKTVAEISHKYGIQIMLGYAIRVNPDDHSAHHLYLLDQILDLIDTEEVVNNLKHFLDIDEPDALEVANDIFEFAHNLHEAAGHNATFNLTTVEDLHREYFPRFDVKLFFNISFGSLPDEEILFKGHYVDSLLDVVPRTPPKVVANFIYYSLLYEFMEYIPENGDELHGACIEKVLYYFKKHVSCMFYQRHDLQEAEQRISHMWQEAKATLQMIFESSGISWINDEYREFALEKMHAMKLVVPSYEATNFDAEYARLSINKTDYLGNVKSLRSFNAAQTRNSLNECPQHIDIGLSLTTPVYVVLANSVIIPVTLLHNEFFFSKTHPNVLNSAHLGALVGHEMLHGFTGEGRWHNEWGYRTLEWDVDLEWEFQRRRQCLYDQYHSYCFGGKPLPQHKMQLENVADIGGVLLAYETYRRWFENVQRTREELVFETLPNLSYTHDQLFFIYYAQMWCVDDYAEESSHTDDVHSPHAFRSFVPLTNLEQFAKAFNCATGTAMNPAKKCKLY